MSAAQDHKSLVKWFNLLPSTKIMATAAIEHEESPNQMKTENAKN